MHDDGDHEEQATDAGEVGEAVPIGYPLVPVSSGDEPLIYGDQVAASDNGGAEVHAGDATISLEPRRANGDVCFVVQLPHETAVGCVEPDLLRTGLVYGASRHEDGPVYVFGIVPDDVDRVTIGGREVTIESNVWFDKSEIDASRDIRVYGTDPEVVASLGGA